MDEAAKDVPLPLHVIRSGLSLLLKDAIGATEVREAATLDEMHAILEADPAFDLLITDLQMRRGCGAKSLGGLRDRFPIPKLVVISASEERSDIIDSLAARANGYIPKSVSAAEVEKALREVLAGRVYVPAVLSEITVSAVQENATTASSAVSGLTERQQQVLNELLRGNSSKQIARELRIAEGTVKIHLASIYRTLDVKTRSEAIVKLNARSIFQVGLGAG